jgi:cation diffusion facilitator family transporter
MSLKCGCLSLGREVLKCKFQCRHGTTEHVKIMKGCALAHLPCIATGNQLLLRLGIARSRKAPTSEYPYGYLKEKFVFSLISAVGVFCFGAGASFINGVYAILDTDHDVDNFGLNFTVLAVSFLVEGFSCYVAVRTIAAGADARGVSFFEHLDTSADPAAVAVMAEDGAAVIGVSIAALATALVRATGYQAWDGIGSLFVGVLLALVALFLIQRNRSVLIGRSMQPDDFNRVVSHLLEDPVVHHVYDARSEEIGPGVYRFSADIDFHGDVIVSRYLNTVDVAALQRKFLRAHSAADTNAEAESTRAFQAMLKEHGSQIVQAVGAEVDHLESEIQRLVPGVRYVDLEADRGRFWLYRASMDGGDVGSGPWQIQFDASPWVLDGAAAAAGRQLIHVPGTSGVAGGSGSRSCSSSGNSGDDHSQANSSGGTIEAVADSSVASNGLNAWNDGHRRVRTFGASALPVGVSSIREGERDHQSRGPRVDIDVATLGASSGQMGSEKEKASEWSIDTYIDASLDAWPMPRGGEESEKEQPSEQSKDCKLGEGPTKVVDVELSRPGGSEQGDSSCMESLASSAPQESRSERVGKAIPGAPSGSLVVDVEGNAPVRVKGAIEQGGQGPDSQKDGVHRSSREVATRAVHRALRGGGLLLGSVPWRRMVRV